MLHGQKELKLRRQLVFAIEAVRKVDAPHSAVGVNLHPQSLYVIGTVRATGKIREVELDLIPAFVQSHGHSANEWLHAGSGLRKKTRYNEAKGGREAGAATSGPDSWMLGNDDEHFYRPKLEPRK